MSDVDEEGTGQRIFIEAIASPVIASVLALFLLFGGWTVTGNPNALSSVQLPADVDRIASVMTLLGFASGLFFDAAIDQLKKQFGTVFGDDTGGGSVTEQSAT